MHSKSYWKRSMGIGVSLALFVLAGNAFGQDVSKAEDAALNQAVSSQEVVPPPRDGTGAGTEAFSGIEAAVADDKAAEFAETIESASEVWKLLSLSPSTSGAGRAL
jgi:hypothetical protein